MSDVCVVVPTIRERSILRFLDAWADQLSGATVLVIEDSPARTFPIDRPDVEHFAWEDIERDLGARAWIIPRRTDCVRSYGFWKAWRRGARIILTLDDDCYPAGGDHIGGHRARLEAPAVLERWVSSGRGLKPRGMPYRGGSDSRACALSHGLWTNVPDLDAMTQLVGGRLEVGFTPIEQVIPPGMYFPMSGMNVGFRRELTPAMYFLLMGPGWDYDRFGDIWCGVLAKKICDHLGLAVASGAPLVDHERASDVWVNLRKEAPGYEVNESFWAAVDRVVLTSESVAGCYRELAGKLALSGPYWDRLREAMAVWAGLFEGAA